MNSRFGNPVPYGRTAVRPAYDDLPELVRTDIAARLGSDPVAIDAATGGFTGGFAGVLTAADGNRLFVKVAGPHTPLVVDAYSREAHLNPALPPQVPAPRLRFAAQIDGWVALGMEPVTGRAPQLPLSPRELALLLDAWAQAARALSPAPRNLIALGLQDFVDVSDQFTQFAKVGSGDVPPEDLPDNAVSRLSELIDLENGFPDAMRGDAVMHGDLRPDNMILGADRAWICDWNFSCLGPVWFDTVSLLIIAHGDGHDAERLFWTHPTSRGVSSDELDAALAGIAGYYLCKSSEPPLERVSPYIRQHQRWSGLVTLDWLSQRRGW